MLNSPNSRPRGVFLRFGVVFLVFVLMCLVLAAMTPAPDASFALGGRLTPSATAGPSPTPVLRPGCGGFHVRVNFLGIKFVNGKPKPKFSVGFRDDTDTDCDGIPDGWDNCPLVANHDQAAAAPDVSYGAACLPESGYRLTNRASQVVIYQMSDGAMHLYSAEGEKLGELSRVGMVRLNPSLVVQQVVGRTYVIGFTNGAGEFRSTQFQSNMLTWGVLDIDVVAVGPESVELRAGESAQFYASGFQRTGIELWFIPRWSATGGSVTSAGLYTAGSRPGTYVVTACRISNVCGTAQVTIVQ